MIPDEVGEMMKDMGYKVTQEYLKGTMDAFGSFDKVRLQGQSFWEFFWDQSSAGMDYIALFFGADFR